MIYAMGDKNTLHTHTHTHTHTHASHSHSHLTPHTSHSHHTRHLHFVVNQYLSAAFAFNASIAGHLDVPLWKVTIQSNRTFVCVGNEPERILNVST